MASTTGFILAVGLIPVAICVFSRRPGMAVFTAILPFAGLLIGGGAAAIGGKSATNEPLVIIAAIITSFVAPWIVAAIAVSSARRSRELQKLVQAIEGKNQFASTDVAQSIVIERHPYRNAAAILLWLAVVAMGLAIFFQGRG